MAGVIFATYLSLSAVRNENFFEVNLRSQSAPVAYQNSQTLGISTSQLPTLWNSRSSASQVSSSGSSSTPSLSARQFPTSSEFAPKSLATNSHHHYRPTRRRSPTPL